MSDMLAQQLITSQQS
ncbi:hypothetical protein PENARI_c002G00384 [Penicillium arizonense]|uniref:Uncharacterized protein n=1 Tax=Penicillium arizonense TaxID=1835702 RepID=A0A1F5LX36_PENAI|nr:hypothetical protein PENARI_c002G00384 [Penicillium arizonense]